MLNDSETRLEKMVQLPLGPRSVGSGAQGLLHFWYLALGRLWWVYSGPECESQRRVEGKDLIICQEGGLTSTNLGLKTGSRQNLYIFITVSKINVGVVLSH